MQGQCKINARSMQDQCEINDRSVRPLPHLKGRRQREIALAWLLGKWRKWSLSVMFLVINQHQCQYFRSTLTSIVFQCPSAVYHFSNNFRRSDQSTKIAGRTFKHFFK